MAEPFTADSHGLSAAVQSFLAARCPWVKPFVASLESLNRSVEVLLFGGLLRDLCLYGPKTANPRDVDLVITNIDSEELFAVLCQHVERTTRFGGLQLRLNSTELDVWPFATTWAFKHGYVKPLSSASLTSTTFLNLEAVAVSVTLSDLTVAEVYSNGFFEAIRDRTLEINLIDNPDPLACVARSLDLASRIGFSIGTRLAHFALPYLQSPDYQQLLLAHSRTNGSSECPTCLFAAWRDAICTSTTGKAVLPPVDVGSFRIHQY